MIELDKTLELLSVAQKPLADMLAQREGGSWFADTLLWFETHALAVATCAALVGAVLALWGSRVLRTCIVCGFMVAGAAVGKRLAGSLQVDLLVGLVLGAGIAGLVGYLFYRWWMGMTMGVAAALLVIAVFSAPRLVTEWPAFEDSRLGVGSAHYDTSRVSQYRWEDFQRYFWEQKPEIVYRNVGPAVLAGLLGMVLGIIAPRLSSIVGTSVLGLVLLCGGVSVVLATKYPAAWSGVQANGRWAIVGAGCFWLFSLLYQATHPARPVVQIPVAPIPVPSA